MKRITLLLTGLLLVLGLSACGGGGGSGSSSNATTTHSSNWDQMTWDKDNWS